MRLRHSESSSTAHIRFSWGGLRFLFGRGRDDFVLFVVAKVHAIVVLPLLVREFQPSLLSTADRIWATDSSKIGIDAASLLFYNIVSGASHINIGTSGVV